VVIVNALLDAALWLAAAGWRIFPCLPSGPRAKAPYKDPDLGLEHGFLDATSNPDTIKRWWSKWPNALIGAAVPADLVVIDVDPRHGGDLGQLI
jgi:hypothetical protein